MSERTVSGKVFPYKYKHSKFRDQATEGGGVYRKVYDWLDANFTSCPAPRRPRDVNWRDDAGRVVARRIDGRDGWGQITVAFDEPPAP
jgi:hypothetical protein